MLKNFENWLLEQNYKPSFVAAQFGSFDYNGEKIYWKIDYYDKSYQHLSENPANPNITNRVLTVMLADEY